MSRFKQTSTNPGQLDDEKLCFEENSKTHYGTNWRFAWLLKAVIPQAGQPIKRAKQSPRTE